jgi:TPR repeat protein
MKVAIIGMPKTGTTALYESIKKELPANTVTSFEPKTLRELNYVINSQQDNALTKIMFGRLSEINFKCESFDKVIIIVRDPRDYLISSLLYKFDNPNLAKNEDKFNQILELFRRKQSNPKSISLTELYGAFDNNSQWDKHLKLYYELIEFINMSNAHVLKYEDFAGNQLSDLSDYLGFSVQNERKLTGWTSKIQRKGVSGDWKNWFTAADLYLKDIFFPVMDTLGYKDWELSGNPIIEKEYSIDYISKLTVQNLSDPTKSQLVTPEYIDNLYSAAKDNKVIPIVRLALLKLEGKHLEPDLVGAMFLLRKASEMGSSRAQREFGKLILENCHDNMKALGLGAEYYFTQAIGENDPESCYYLGNMFLQGNSIPINVNEAFKLFLQGSELGSKSCMRKLAMCYEKGIGTNRDKDLAKHWLKQRS